MTARRRVLRAGLLAVLLASWAGAAQPPPEKAPAAPPLSPRLQQVRNRIAALFQHRGSTPAPPDPRLNPFRSPGSAPVVAVGEPGGRDGGAPPEPAPVVASSDLDLLQQSVAKLKVNGTVIIGGRIHLVINAKPYREGEVIQVQLDGEPFYLRLRKVSGNSVTLALNSAEMTLKF